VFWLMFGGFNLAFFMMHLTGLRGMPRRVSTYPEGIGWDRLNMLSTIGAFILAAGIALFIVDFFRHRRVGPPAGRNPWGAATLEWLYPVVTPGYNFRAIPQIRSREPLWDQPELTQGDPAMLRGALRACPDHRRETIGCDPVSGAPIQIVRLPHPTWFPLISAFGLAVLFTATLASVYWICAVGAVIALIGLTGWAWEPSDSGVTRDSGLDGLRLPVNIVDRRSHLYHGVAGTLLISFALYASILFAGLYLWNTQPQAADATARPDAIYAWGALIGAAVTALFSAAANHSAVRARFGQAAILDCGLGLSALITGAALAASLLGVDPWVTAFGAVGWAMVVFVCAYLVVTAYWAFFNALRKAVGAVRPGQTLPDFLLASFAQAAAVMTAGAAAAFLVLGALS